jgi:hypothetical protein
VRVSGVFLVLDFVAALLQGANGQTVQVTGFVKDGNGHPLNASQISVDDAHGNSVGHGASNIRGYYAIQAGSGAVSVSCEVDTNSVTYSPNPDHELLTVKSKSASGNCTLYQVTTDLAYWDEVARRIRAEASTNQVAGTIYSLEWKKIDSSGLPPDSKAVAARQFKSMAWGKGVADYTFTDYANVNQLALSKALHGDQTALANLPPSVARDVRALNSGVQQ